MTDPQADDGTRDVGVGDALLLALGGLALRLGLTDDALLYVRPEFQPFLVVSGLVLVVLSLDVLWRAWRGGPRTLATPPRAPAVAWLLLVPVAAAMSVPAAPLGAFATAVGVSAADAQPRLSARPAEPSLPAERDGAVPLSLGEFVVWTQLDDGRILDGARVRLLGFVSRVDDDGFRLTRFAASCCAADARPVHVDVVDAQPVHPLDRWVEVEGVWSAGPAEPRSDAPPTLAATEVTPTPAPASPYEF